MLSKMNEEKLDRVNKIVVNFTSGKIGRMQFSDDLDKEFTTTFNNRRCDPYNIIRPLMDDMPLKDNGEYIFADYNERFAKILMLMLEP